jgi:hypothetical protein
MKEPERTRHRGASEKAEVLMPDGCRWLKRRMILLAATLLVAPAMAPGETPETTTGFKAGRLRVSIDATGRVRSLLDQDATKEYLVDEQPAPLLSIERNHRVVTPVSMTTDGAGSELTITYPGDNAKATIEVGVRATYVTFELKRFAGSPPDRVHWGPFPTSIRGTIGEIVGVVRNDTFAMGIQGLNPKTSAGAAGTQLGSVLKAWSEDRTRERIRSIGEAKKVLVPALAGPDATLTGSRIALFGCRPGEALDVLGQIEASEGLPHPMLDGVWAKLSPKATLSYLIIPFGAANLDEVITIARRAGLKYIYHPNPFRSWGHFNLDAGSFPEGVESLRRDVERAAGAGIRVGLHTLSNFIQPNDPYVSPVPHPHLARVGSSSLAAAIDEAATTIPVVDPTRFRYRQSLSTAVIAAELVRYDAVSEKAPWALLGCTRGAFGTRAGAHPAGADIGKLWDHPYKVFLPDIQLQDEVAARIAQLFNQAGLRQVSFDGLEGCQVTGEGDYAEARFVKRCFDDWREEVISDSSQLKHYTWHIHTRMNWGEPWGKAMREGMPEYRIRNQEFFRRNLLPPMLGWFQIQATSAGREAAAVDDVEWALAKCAGFSAGCSWVTDAGTMKALGQADAILRAIREWDRARNLNVFSAEQLARLRDPNNEFHLDAVGEGQWRLTATAFSRRLVYNADQPDTRPSAGASWAVDNRFADQPLRFVMRVTAKGKNGTVNNPAFLVGGQKVTFAARLEPQQYLVSEGDGRGVVCDANWNPLRTVQADSAVPVLPTGTSRIGLKCEVAGEPLPRVEVRFKMKGSPEAVGSSGR